MKERVGFIRRFPALVLDAIIILVLAFPFGRPALRLLKMLGVPLSSIDTNAAAWGTLLFDFWTIAIFVMLIEVLVGASPGKLIMRLKVAREDGGHASMGRRLGRYLGKACCLLIIPPFGMTEIEAVVFSFLAIGVVSLLGTFLIFGPKKETLYDRLAKTAVFAR